MVEQRFRLRGEIDLATRDELTHNLLTFVRCSGDDIAIDCTDLVFIDSSGIAVLADAQKDLMDMGRRLRLTNLDATPRRIVEVLGLVEFFNLDDRA